MFESLTDRLGGIFSGLKGKGKLTEDDINSAMREIRLALLEADVNYKVVKEFTNSIKEKAIGQDVLSKLNPSQMLVKIVHDELVKLLGDDDNSLKFNENGLSIFMLVGLQGTGKTTQVGKLANLLRKKHNGFTKLFTRNQPRYTFVIPFDRDSPSNFTFIFFIFEFSEPKFHHFLYEKKPGLIPG